MELTGAEQCDERKPGCERCERRGELCPGYRDKSQLVFRSMNESAAARAGHVIQYPSSATQSEAVVRFAPATQFVHESLTAVRPSSDWEGQAVNHFFYNYVLLPTADRRGYLEFLPDLCAKNRQHAGLRDALLAAAMASFGNVYNAADIRNQAQKHYGHALRSTMGMLDNTESAKSNASLATIILLQKFETISGQKARNPDPHEEALSRLQQMRTDEDLMRPVAQSLAFVIQSRLTISELDACGRWSESSEPGTAVRVEMGPRKELWQLLSRTSQICRRLRQLVANASQIEDRCNTIKEASKQTFALYMEISVWPRSVSKKDEFRTFVSAEMQDIVPNFPKAYHVFDNVQHGGLWISFWCMQLHFLQHMRLFIETFSAEHAMISSSSSTLIKQLHTDQASIVDNICGSSTYMLGELGDDGRLRCGSEAKALGAYFLLRALYVAMQLEDISSTQRAYILDRMLQIGQSKGIGQALRGRDRWLRTHPEFGVAMES